MTTPAPDFDQQERQLRSALALASADYDRLSLQTMQGGSTDDLATVEAEIRDYEQCLSRLAAARRAAAAAAVAETSEELDRRLADAKTRALAASAKREKAAAKLEKTISDLHAQMDEVHALGEEARQAVHEAARILGAAVPGGRQSAAEFANTTASGPALGCSISTPMICRLRAALAGRRLLGPVEFVGCTDNDTPLAVAAAADSQALNDRLDGWTVDNLRQALALREEEHA